MPQRGFLLILAATALGSLLTALSLHQSLQRERVELAAVRKAKTAAEGGTAAAAQEAEKLKAAAGASDALARKLESAIGELKEKVDRVASELAARDQTLHNAASQVQGKVVELATALGEIKAQAAAHSTSLATKIDELAKSKDQGAPVAVQLAALEARLKEKEAQLQSLTVERDRITADLRKREAAVQKLEKDLEVERSRPRASLAAPRVEDKPPPTVPVATKVEAVESSDGVVVLGAGKKSGLETGHVLTISRDGKAIGRVRVIKVYDELAGAEIIETQPGEQIRRDDRAATAEMSSTSPGAVTPGPVTLPLSKSEPPPPPPAPGK